jgi:hypothetical protein
VGQVKKRCLIGTAKAVERPGAAKKEASDNLNDILVAGLDFERRTDW